MSDPRNIPKDVRAVAMQVADGWGLDEFGRGVHALEIARTIMADRERVAVEKIDSAKFDCLPEDIRRVALDACTDQETGNSACDDFVYVAARAVALDRERR